MNDCHSDVSPVNISDFDYFGGGQKWCFVKISQNFIKSPLKICPGPKKNMCVFQVSRHYLGFCPDPKHFIVNCEQILSNLLENWGKCIKKCNFYVKYFDKIKCYADRPYLVFSKLKPETHSSSLIRHIGQCDSTRYFSPSKFNCFYVSLYVETYEDLHDNNILN